MTSANTFPMITFDGGTILMSANGSSFDLLLSPGLQAEPLRSSIFEMTTQWANVMTLGRGVDRTQSQGRISCVAVHEDEDIIVRVLTPSEGPVSDEELKSLIKLLGVAETDLTATTSAAAG
jgi:hypothetical protein